MNSDQELAHEIKIKFGTAPSDPNSYQLEKIKQDIQDLVAKGITPSENDWAEIVKKHCTSAGSYFYRGADTSDLITLMQLATKK
ncbi:MULTISPECIES: hypothetical protein [Halomonas]|uniref:hypothetical protein n=1 Tax=Halomonas TaxID=2745 RepID=UPI001C9446E0|nr:MULTISPECIES: hypothetical protein [Halomonas]MBY6209375.1 hypothetical protein [Halomonas sp. DP3Y7-2]MBY6229530.1 hypothetical protein [Halomonas sp. DP3Y7-1]MCA0917411.1 hypothetical protein [Halomonas denitrificans]